MWRRTATVAALLTVIPVGGGVAVAGSTPDLTAAGPTSVTGTEASAVFRIADRTIRQVRYTDGGTLRYTFAVTNGGRLPVTIHGLADDEPGTPPVHLHGADRARRRGATYTSRRVRPAT